MLLPSHEVWTSEPTPGGPGPGEQVEGNPDRVLLVDDGSYEDSVVLDNGTRSLVLAAVFTDYDGDGDQDILMPSDRGLPAALWERDGEDWRDVAPDLGAALDLDAMGVASTDWNGDGQLDYCITDTGPMRCLISGEGGFVESAAALGLVPPASEASTPTVGWTVELGDLDNDGDLDAFQSSGSVFGSPDDPADGFPDLFWEGRQDGTFDVRDDMAAAVLVGPRYPDHYGAAMADVDRDGWLDLLVTPDAGAPQLWMNRCGAGRFLSVDLVDSASNSEACGARVELTVGGQTRVREITNMRGQGQGPSLVHFGVGPADAAERLRVVWPDGEVEEQAEVPTGGWLTIRR